MPGVTWLDAEDARVAAIIAHEAQWEPPPDDAEQAERYLAALESPPDTQEEEDDDWKRPWTGDGEAFAAGFLHHVPDLPGTGFAAGGEFDLLEPGPDLARLVAAHAGRGHERLGESELIGVLCGWARMESWAAAGKAAAVAALRARRERQARERQQAHLAEHVDDEVAAALVLTGQASRVLGEQCGRLARLPRVLAALRAGRVDWRRAAVLVTELAAVSDEQAAAEIAARLVPGAEHSTTAQLQRAARRAVLAHDPAAAQRRKESAAAEAGVFVFPESSGNAAIAGRELPEDEVLAADRRLSAIARWLRDRGAEGNVHQLRAAALLALLTGRPVADLAPAGALAVPGQPVAQAGVPAVSGTINLVVPLGALAGLHEVPGEVAGYGPIDAVTCRGLARRLTASPATRWFLTLTDQQGRAVAHGVVPAWAGPPPAGMAAIRWAGGLLQRLDWLERGTSCGHSGQEPGYRPSARLRRLVRARQRHCCFPGCGRPATACDLDHTVAWDDGGRTCECNLSPLCRRHHRAKQADGWRLEQPRPAVLVWTLPSGRSYRVRPLRYPDDGAVP